MQVEAIPTADLPLTRTDWLPVVGRGGKGPFVFPTKVGGRIGGPNPFPMEFG
jgi:hypothetical protein